MESLTAEQLDQYPDAAPSPASLSQEQLDHLPDSPDAHSLSQEQLDVLPDHPDQGFRFPTAGHPIAAMMGNALIDLGKSAASAMGQVGKIWGAAKNIVSADPGKSWSENAQNYFAQIPDLRNADPVVVDSLKDQAIGPNNTGFLASAKQQLISDDHGVLMKALIGLSMPEQLAARETVSVLQSMGKMSASDARSLLSQEDFNFNDVVNYYWKDPKNMMERSLRFATGLASTIMFDPLMVFNPMAELNKEGGKFVTIAGQVVDLTKMGTAEKLLHRNAGKIDKILEDGYKIAEPGETVLQNADLLNQYTSGKIGLEDLQSGLMVPGKQQIPLIATINQARFEKPGLMSDLKNGVRGPQLGVKIPFSNLGINLDLPMAPISRFGGEMVDKFSNNIGKIVDSNGVTGGIHRAWNQLFTKTGQPIYDAAARTYEGSKYASANSINEFYKNAMSLVGDATDAEVNDIIHSLEFGHVPNKADVLAEFGKVPFEQDLSRGATEFATPIQPTKELLSLEQTAQDREVWARMPEAHQNFVSQSRNVLDGLAADYKNRPGIPFTELNPFGEGWVRTYIKHKFNDQYFESMKDVNRSMDYALDNLGSTIGKVDKGAFGRQYRGSILEANADSLEKFGVKLFVDDPVELVTTRIHEMQDQARRYDLMDAATKEAIEIHPGEAVPDGFVKFRPEDWKQDTTVFEHPNGPQPKAFVPPFFQQAFKAEEIKSAGGIPKDIYLPAPVYDNMLYKIGGRSYGKAMDLLIDVNNKFMFPFRNAALFGPGFIGRHVMSRATNFLTSGVTDPIRSIFDSVKFFSPLEKDAMFSFKDAAGIEFQVTKDELRTMAHEQGVIGASLSNIANASGYDYAENIASTYLQRENMGKKMANVFDAVSLWRTNRALIENSDNIFRMGLFLDRLKQGFSAQASGEAVERYFYNFNNTPQTQDVMRRIFPFSSFAMKTGEKMLGELKDGQLGRLAIPSKVAQVLNGAFLPDTDVRDAMETTMPSYLKILSAHGPLLPGGREAVIEAPWTTHAIEFFLDPQKNLHPALQVLFSAFSGKSDDVVDTQTTQDKMIRSAVDQIWQYAPFEVREGLALAEINGMFDSGGYIRDLINKTGMDKFGTLVPHSPFASRYKIPPPVSEGGNQSIKFGNALEFGKYMEKHSDENWLYKLVFPQRIGEEDMTPDKYQQVTERGEWIRQHFRDMSLGLVRIDKTDSQFMVHMGAMDRQIKGLKNDILQEQVQIGLLPNQDKLSDEDYLKQHSASNYKMGQLLQLQQKQAVLKTYYNWYLGMEKQYPGMNVQDLIFGTDKYLVDWSEKPDVKAYDPRFLKKDHFQNLIKEGQTPNMEDEGN